jgi:WD40 repeat protein
MRKLLAIVIACLLSTAISVTPANAADPTYVSSLDLQGISYGQIAFAPDGTLYAAASDENKVYVYNPGETSYDTSRTLVLTRASAKAWALAISPDGTVFVSDQAAAPSGQDTIYVFPPGADSTTTPIGLRGGRLQYGGMAVASNGDLYVIPSGPNGTSVAVYDDFNSGAVPNPTKAITGMNGASDVAFDAQGNLYVAEFASVNRIRVFAPGSSGAATALSTINGAFQVLSLAVKGDVVVAARSGPNTSPYIFDSGVNTFETIPGFSLMRGVAFEPGTSFIYVASLDGQEIKKYLITRGLVNPTISSIAPSTGPASGGTTVTITGLEFFSGATVTVGGVACTNVVRVSAVSITCDTPPGSGTASVTVTNPDTGTVTSAGAFMYDAAAATGGGTTFTPVVLEVNPRNVSVSNEIVTLFGANLKDATHVVINGLRVEIINRAANRISFRAPAGLAGSHDIHVVFPGLTLIEEEGLTYRALVSSGARTVVPGFDMNKTVLKKKMKKEIRQFLRANSDFTTVVCKGFTSRPANAMDKRLARQRGQAACDYISTRNPDLTVRVLKGSHTDKAGTSVRRVRVTLR